MTHVDPVEFVPIFAFLENERKPPVGTACQISA